MPINRVAGYHLETLLWIARLGTFGAAAARLNTTQPAISARVRELEAHLGVKLFRRDGRLMTLTPAGRQLVRESESLWTRFQDVLLGCSGLSEASGVVRIGAGEIAAASCLPGFVARIEQDLPNVTLEVEIALTADLIDGLLGGRTDLAFGAGQIAHPSLKSSPIGTADLLWLASPKAVAAVEQGSKLSDFPLWSLSSHSPLYRIMRDAIARSEMARLPVNLCNNMRTMIDLVIAGNGIGIFPGSMVASQLATGQLVPLPGIAPITPVEFQVAIRAGEADPLILAIFERASRLDIRQAGTG